MIHEIRLRQVIEADLPIFFEQQLDPTANHMAAFTVQDPSDRGAFAARWARLLGNSDIVLRTIVADGQVTGYVASHQQAGEREVTYWIGRDYWGKGIATRALLLFLQETRDRPVLARAAKDNLASLRVLEKCGFTICGYDRGFAAARGAEIDEAILKLVPDEAVG